MATLKIVAPKPVCNAQRAGHTCELFVHSDKLMHRDGTFVWAGCDGCVGDGKFRKQNQQSFKTYVAGDCFRCEGKGYQTPADVARNRVYDDNYRAIMP